MSEPESIIYRRTGRERRASGVVVMRDQRAGFLKVKPEHPHWHPVWISTAEIEAGKNGRKQPAGKRQRAKEAPEGENQGQPANPTPDEAQANLEANKWERWEVDGDWIVGTRNAHVECCGLTETQVRAIQDTLNRTSP